MVGLAETKNGAVVRKHMGYGYIAAPHAAAIQTFYEDYFNPYLNFHRPCGVPEQTVNSKGKGKRRYRWYATPWEILRQLPGLAAHLRSDILVEDSGTPGTSSDRHGSGGGYAVSETEAVRQLPATTERMRKGIGAAGKSNINPNTHVKIVL